MGAKRALGILVAYFGAQLCVSFIVGLALGLARTFQRREPHADSQLDPGLVVMMGLLGVLAGSALAYVLARRSFGDSSREQFAHSVGLRGATSRQLLLAAAVGLLVCACYSLIVAKLFPPQAEQLMNPLALAAAQAGWPRHVWTLLVLIVAPLNEEFMFRGVLFSGLARSWSAFGAACASSLLFMAAHLTGFTPYWPALGAVLTLGAAAQTARILSSSLMPGMAMHAAYNFGLVLLVYSQG